MMMMMHFVLFMWWTSFLVLAAVLNSSVVVFVSAFPDGTPSCTEGLGVTDSAHTQRQSTCILLLFSLCPLAYKLVKVISSSFLVKAIICAHAFFSMSVMLCTIPAGNTAGNGQLADGCFAVFIDERELLEPDEVDLVANQVYKIEIKTNTACDSAREFRGHYFRLGRGINNVETPEAFSDLDEKSKIVVPCVSEDIAAFTHTDNGFKTAASATLTFSGDDNYTQVAGGDSGIPLDVTIVVANCDPDESPLVANVEPCDPTNSTYYYTQYKINFVVAPASDASTTSAAPAGLTTNHNSIDSAAWMVCWTMIIIITVLIR
jgi:hypothetical protein